MSVKTRFAPSPTGDLHIGGARTALYSWLHARANGGQFVLRIEDTDLERSTPEAVQAIMDGMKWLQLDWDEGPIFQTDRFSRYKEVIQQLVKQGDAYPCFCSSERLDAMRKEQKENKVKWRYDGKCRDLKAGDLDLSKDHVIRFKNPTDGAVTFKDVVKGEITIQNQELDDLIIARTDGAPTYNFTVVIDDMDMQITQVIRGDDHINNTPRQINIFKALDVQPPEYGHVPMILGDDGKKLSKRHGAISVMQYRDDGYLPHAVLNYLVRLGWSHGDQEVFSIDELKKIFDINEINKAPSTFNTEKLNWLNQQYIKSTPIDQLLPHLQWHLEQQGIDLNDGPDVGGLVKEFAERVQTLKDLVAILRPYYADFEDFDAKAAKKHLRPVAKPALEKLYQKFSELQKWEATNLQKAVDSTAEELDVGMGKVGMPLRVAITGAGMSPAIDLTLLWVGKTRTLSRLQQAISFIEQREALS